jgi:hypothetical protein
MNVDPELVRRLDESIRSSLQAVRDGYFSWLIWSAFAVAVGVLLEGPEVVHELLNTRRSPQREVARWIKFLGLTGWIFVIVGVAGEGLSEGLVSKADGILQMFNDILLTDSLTRATEANTQAKSADFTAALANRNAGRANQRAQGLSVKAKQLEKENLATQQQLEDERKTRLEMEASLAPRYLWVGTGTHNIAPLRAYEGTKVEIQVIQDAESVRAATELAFVLSSAKWNVAPPTIVVGGNMLDGVRTTRFFSRSRGMLIGSRSSRAEMALLDFLSANGWEAEEAGIRPDEARAENNLLISVGMKPNPYFEPDWLKKGEQEVKQRQLEINKMMKELLKQMPAQ